MLRRPPRSTLFPTRRSSDLAGAGWVDRIELAVKRRQLHRHIDARQRTIAIRIDQRNRLPAVDRSEEHTSELQSHSDLVCRLLLEKKNEPKQLHSYTCIPINL